MSSDLTAQIRSGKISTLQIVIIAAGLARGLPFIKRVVAEIAAGSDSTA